MNEIQKISKTLAFLGQELVGEIITHSTVKEIPDQTEILREGQYVKVIPIVLSGLVKVSTRYQDKELLLYYIQPNESCIMSFSAGMDNQPSRVTALTEEKSTILLIPVDQVSRWIRQFPNFNLLFYQQYNRRYADLIDTINHLLYDKLDKRIYDYLKGKVALTHRNPVRITHRQMAQELGTAREVVSRMLKKLEEEGKVKQLTTGVKILEL